MGTEVFSHHGVPDIHGCDLAFPVVVSSLDYLQRDSDAKARIYYCSNTKFDFIVGLVVVQHVRLSTILQNNDFDLIQAVSEERSLYLYCRKSEILTLSGTLYINDRL